MLYICIITTIVTISYCFIVLLFLFGWRKIKIFQKENTFKAEASISLIIALRNEEKNIPFLIESILNQSLNHTCFELILIDDHSTDNTNQLCNEFKKSIKNLSVLKLDNLTGKKNAILLGIKHANGQLIVTTDADCVHNKNWLETILQFYLKYKPKMIIGPVLMRSKKLFEGIQSLDFYSLIVSGAGATGIERPIMCNGANLAFEKSLLSKNSNILNHDFVSGDDIFLMLNLKKTQTSKILFLKSTDALVYTTSQPTFNQFLNQRKRWASKSKGYVDKDIIFTACAVLTMNFLLGLNVFLVLIYIPTWKILAIQVILKLTVDLAFLTKTQSFFKEQKILTYFIQTQIFNIFIIPYVAISGIFSSFKWKDRKYTI
jgi:poly-beta-1,6-N-acetyl-D-glucosamine synthase